MAWLLRNLSPERVIFAVILLAWVGIGFMWAGYRTLGYWLCAPCALMLAALVLIGFPVLIYANWKHGRRGPQNPAP
jgi:hypothetical protein